MEESYYSWCKCKKWKNCNFTKEVEGKKGKSVEHLVSRATINGSIHQRLNGTACDISRAACLRTIGGRRRVSFPRWTRIEILPPRELTRTSNRNLSQTDSLLLNGGKISLKYIRRNMEICIDFNWKIARSRLME